MPSSARAGWIYFESPLEVEAAKVVPYRPTYTQSCPAVIRGVLQLWKRRITKWCTPSTASTKLSISGMRLASSLPYFSLGVNSSSCLPKPVSPHISCRWLVFQNVWGEEWYALRRIAKGFVKSNILYTFYGLCELQLRKPCKFPVKQIFFYHMKATCYLKGQSRQILCYILASRKSN